MTVKLSPKIKKEVSEVIKEFGYKSVKDFIEDALRYRILELKKAEFLSKVKEIKKTMQKRGLEKKDILKDFDKFYHQK